MTSLLHSLFHACLVAVYLGCACWALVFGSALVFRVRAQRLLRRSSTFTPPVSLLKPVYGLEKELRENLRTACTQDYPDYQVVFSVQRTDDPAIPILRSLQTEFGSEHVSVAIESAHVGMNGKINNLAGALPHALHDILVISDSDVYLPSDYLRQVVAPLADSSVGAVCTFFRASHARAWYENVELLTINADHIALAMLGNLVGVGDFCFGASTALRRDTLNALGGFAVLGDYLVEDNELGQRVLRTGKRLLLLPYVVDTIVDLPDARTWWVKQTYWDQNTRAAVPWAFAATFFLRVIPMALAAVALSGGSATALEALALALVTRLSAAVAVLGVALRDRTGLSAMWLIPIKDCLSLFWFVRAWSKRTVTWRGVEMALTADGRLRPLEPGP